MTIASVEDRVAAGVDWLNANGPAEWWDRINYDTLDIDDGQVCVLGQVFASEATETGSYNGWEYAILHGGIANITVKYGFTPYFIRAVDAPELRDEWINRIEGIRAEVAA